MIEPILILGIPVDFILFGLTLLGVALFHHKTLQVALTGLAVIVVYQFVFTGFKPGPGLPGLALQIQRELIARSRRGRSTPRDRPAARSAAGRTPKGSPSSRRL